MVLRFWGKSELRDRTVEEITEWMDRLYHAETLCLDAWEIRTAESRESGSRDASAIMRAPIGAGPKYLKKARIAEARQLKAETRTGAKSGCGIVFVILLLATIAAAVFLLFR